MVDQDVWTVKPLQASMPQQQYINFEIRITNWQAVRALARLAELLTEMQEDLPWRDEPKEAMKALQFAVRRMVPKQKRSEIE